MPNLLKCFGPRLFLWTCFCVFASAKPFNDRITHDPFLTKLWIAHKNIPTESLMKLSKPTLLSVRSGKFDTSIINQGKHATFEARANSAIVMSNRMKYSRDGGWPRRP